MKTALRPMLVTTAPLPPDDARYAYEVKWDSFRALVSVDRGEARVSSRNGHDMTVHYPELRALGRLLGQDVVLDGEIVALDEHGRPDFAALWMRRRILEGLNVNGPYWCTPETHIGSISLRGNQADGA